MWFTNCFTNFLKRSAFLAFTIILAGCAMAPAATDSASAIPEISAPDVILPSELPTEGELRVNMPFNAVSLNPLYTKDKDMNALLSLTFEPAIRIDESGKFQPCVIYDWSTDDTGLVYTFHLRKNVKFHNGTLVTATDLVSTIEQIKTFDPANCSYAKYASAVVSAQATDDQTLVVTTQRTSLDILYFMNFPVMPKSVYSGAGLETATMPVGTGPYVAESYDKESGLVFSCYDQWWKEQPAIKKVYAVPCANESEKINAYQKNEINCVLSSSITLKSFSSVNKSNVFSAVLPEYDCLLPNIRKAALGKTALRRALSAAIDRRELISAGLMGMGIATDTPLRPDLWYFDGMDVVSYDAQTVTQLFSEAGYTQQEGKLVDSGGAQLSFELIVYEDETLLYRENIATLIAKQYSRAGIDVTVKLLSKKDFAAALQNGSFDLAFCSYHMKQNNNVSFLFAEGSNYGGYDSAPLANALAQTEACLESNAQSAYVALITALREEMPNIGLDFRYYAMMIDDSMAGIDRIAYSDVFADIGDWTVAK